MKDYKFCAETTIDIHIIADTKEQARANIKQHLDGLRAHRMEYLAYVARQAGTIGRIAIRLPDNEPRLDDITKTHMPLTISGKVSSRFSNPVVCGECGALEAHCQCGGSVAPAYQVIQGPIEGQRARPLFEEPEDDEEDGWPPEFEAIHLTADRAEALNQTVREQMEGFQRDTLTLPGWHFREPDAEDPDDLP